MSILLFAVFLLIVWGIKWRLEGGEEKPGEACEMACDITRPRLIGMPNEDRAYVLREIKRTAARRDGLFFHPGHAWAFVDKDLVEIGPDEITLRLLGDIESVRSAKKAGDEIRQGEECWVIRNKGRSVRQASPVSGIVARVNEGAIESPGEIRESPYTKGWLFAVKPANLAGDIKNLFSGSLADEWLFLTRKRINAFFTPSAAFETAQDGGELIGDIGSLVTDEQWEKLSSELFKRVE